MIVDHEQLLSTVPDFLRKKTARSFNFVGQYANYKWHSCIGAQRLKFGRCQLVLGQTVFEVRYFLEGSKFGFGGRTLLKKRPAFFCLPTMFEVQFRGVFWVCSKVRCSVHEVRKQDSISSKSVQAKVRNVRDLIQHYNVGRRV